jgi:anti-sigma factor RsiW
LGTGALYYHKTQDKKKEETMDPHISKEQLNTFVDGEMSESESELIQVHVEACGKCAAYVGDLRSLFADLSSLESAPDAPGLKNDTMQLWRMMNQQTRPSESRFNPPGLKSSYKLIAVGAVAAGLAIGTIFGSIASLGLMPDNNEMQFSSVVLQENDQTINDTYLAMIINSGQDDL